MPLESKKLAKEDLWVSLIVVVLTGIFLFYILGMDTSSTEQKDIPVTSSAESIAEIQEVKIEDKTYSRVEQSKSVARAKQESTNSSYAGTPIETLSYEVSSDNAILDTVNIEIKQDSLGNTTTIADTMAVDTMEQNTTEKFVGQEETETAQCIIIVGSYSSQKNTDKMYGKLQKAGFQAFTTPYKNYKRVGIYSPCENSTLNKNLANIRSKFASDAVIFEN